MSRKYTQLVVLNLLFELSSASICSVTDRR